MILAIVMECFVLKCNSLTKNRVQRLRRRKIRQNYYFPNKESKKAKLLDEIKMRLRDEKEIREGSSRSFSMSDLFNGE